MLLRASPVEYLPIIKAHVFKTSHLNACPTTQVALNTGILLLYRQTGVKGVSESCGKAP